MPQHLSINNCRSYVSAHLHSGSKGIPGGFKRPPSVTIARQTGARGRTIGAKLEAALRAANPKAELPWTLFDENLVTEVLQDNDLPAELEKFMPDDALGELEGAINELLGRHPSLWSLFEKTSSTIARLARMGHSIIVGRGGNEVTRSFNNVLHICLIGSEQSRIRQMVEVHGMSDAGARKFINEEDDARSRYVKKHFNSDFLDPMRYDWTLNTDHMDDDQIVRALISVIESRS